MGPYIHKWVNGTSRPRPDHIRIIARFLGVDEVWLNLGHEPVVSADCASVQSHKATGVVMTIAGLIKQHGGRVTFPDAAEKTPHLFVNFDADRYGLIVVVPQIAGDSLSFIVPEPIRQHRIVGVITQAGIGTHSFTADVFDLTNSPRQVFGGFSVIEFDQNTKGELRAKGKKHPVIPVRSFADLVKAKG